ncbi:MAG: DUF2207 domain-containing protein [Bifidobacterium sp.]|jgi:uncharacterized membrane protein|nr:DUF2207 domain-containing protein [Bifidobacterium sp.]MCI1864758.1 DUF2207 domain-containing protein [Bifidobacterium sp.]
MTIRRALYSGVIAIISAALIVGLGLVAIVSHGDGADLSYRTLDYDAQVLSNGDLKVTQRIDMRLRDRGDGDSSRPWKQLYQQYSINPANLTSIRDISVRNLTTGQTYARIQPRSPSTVSTSTWDEDYANHWYVADVTGGANDPQPYDAENASGRKTVEIGWNIPATVRASSLKFEVSMTLAGVSTAYRDVASFQWEPVGKSNQIPIGTLTGRLSFPPGIHSSNSWAWLHYEGTSSTSRGAGGKLAFTAYDVRAGQYLDLVAMFDSSAAHGVTRTVDRNAKTTIMSDEAKQEREWRDRQHSTVVRNLILWVLLAAASAILSVLGIVASIRSNRRFGYRGDIEYWREPPDLDPAAAASMMAVLEPVSAQTLSSRQMSATVLSLAERKAIAIYPGPSSTYAGIDMSTANAASVAALIGSHSSDVKRLSQTSTIVILPVCGTNRESLRLSNTQNEALSLLESAGEIIGSPVFDLRQMRRAFREGKAGYAGQQGFETAASNAFAMLGATRSIGAGATAVGVVGLLLGIGSLMFFVQQSQVALAVVLAAPTMACALFTLISGRHKELTEPGQRYAGQVMGLKRYLEDFSDFTDRGAADLALWDNYLVYATAFGISRTVLRQLAQSCPELRDPRWLDAQAYGSLLYWSYRPYFWGSTAFGPATGGVGADPSAFGGDFGDVGSQLSAGFAQIRSTIHAASSSSGSGGSFSGGGFGGSFGGSGGGSFGGR